MQRFFQGKYTESFNSQATIDLLEVEKGVLCRKDEAASRTGISRSNKLSNKPESVALKPDACSIKLQDQYESSSTPKSPKRKKIRWFRKRSASDSAALKSQSLCISY